MTIIPITDLERQLNKTPLSLSLGNFDGVHLGHQALIERAKGAPLASAVFTFTDKKQGVITPSYEKQRLFEALGVEFLFIAPFPLFRELSPEAFVSYLKEKLSASLLVCGFNFRFGKNAIGSADTLSRLAEENGMTAAVVEPVLFEGEPISASRIRASLSKGDLTEVQAMLGRPYTVSGKVVRGYGIGKTLSFPTLNLESENPLLLPHGVYVTRAYLDGAVYSAITNIGKNPTFSRDDTTCETHLLAASGDFYEKPLSLEFLSYLRGELTFSSPDDLKAQVLADIQKALALHGIITND